MIRFALSLVVFAHLAGSALAADEKRPNILFIYADDQSYKTIGCYGAGPEWAKTPNIDKLAAGGVRFERSYLGPWCMPSRASLLTGRLQHGVMSMTMEGSYPGSKYDPAQCPFVPAEFRKQGYHTAQIGKWHTGTDAGFGRDWDYQVVWNRPAHPENAGNYYKEQILNTNGGPDVMTKGYSTDNYTDLACDYIQGDTRDPEKPWYLWLCYGAIHGPTTPADRHKGMFRSNRAKVPADIVGPWPDKPKYLEGTAAWTMGPDGKPYMAKKKGGEVQFDANAPGKTFDQWIQQVNECNAAVDEGVGRVLDALAASDQLDNTLVVYSADQGFGLGEHGFTQKVAPYDATISSPMIFNWPGQVPVGKVCKHPINSPDLIDYFCRAAGVTVPWKTHGRDIRPLLKNPTTTDWNSPLIFTHTSRSYGAETDEIPTDGRLTSSSGVPWYALLRDGKYKYVRNLVEGETEELYNLDADPEELTNLATSPAHATLLKELRAKAIAELRRTDAKFVDKMPKTKAEIEGGRAEGGGGKADQKSSALNSPLPTQHSPFHLVSQTKAAVKSLDIYWIDVEGGAATLIVTPAGESVLIDSGNPGVRDSNRIFQVATKEAGLKKIDHLITTHYHRDHFGGAAQLSASIPIGEVHDNGAFEGQREKADPEYYGFKADKRSVVSPGDEIVLKPAGDGVIPLSLRCLGARQKFVDAKGETNECCAANVEKPVDNSDNANSVVMLLKFGDFDFLDTGDLTWNREFDLVCPANRVGKVDVFQASHHGLDVSNNPVLIKSIEPRVAIVNNGVTKGNQPVMFATLQETKSIEQVYQVHKTHREDGSSHNVPDEFIANHDKECKGEHLKLTVAADGKSYTVSVPSTGHTKTYGSK